MSSQSIPLEHDRPRDPHVAIARHGARLEALEKEQDDQKGSLRRIDAKLDKLKDKVEQRFFTLLLFAIAQLATGAAAVIGVLLTRKG